MIRSESFNLGQIVTKNVQILDNTDNVLNYEEMIILREAIHLSAYHKSKNRPVFQQSTITSEIGKSTPFGKVCQKLFQLPSSVQGIPCRIFLACNGIKDGNGQFEITSLSAMTELKVERCDAPASTFQSKTMRRSKFILL